MIKTKKKFKRFLKWLRGGERRYEKIMFHYSATDHYINVFCSSKHSEVKNFAWKMMNLHLKAMMKINRL
jgi:hypothetical protein